MHKVLIIGAGFSGLTAAKILARAKSPRLEITLIDKKVSADFLPLLPDILGRSLAPENLSLSIADFSRRHKIKFINDTVESLDLEKRLVHAKGQVLAYDYLMVSSGSETNFYGNENIRQHAYSLDSVADAKRIIRALEDRIDLDSLIIAGAGYTGIETATNLRIYFKRRNLHKKIVIVERGQDILGPLPGWMKDYVRANLASLGIEIVLSSTVEKISAETVYLSGGRVYEKAMLIWAAGVKTAAFLERPGLEKNPQGRIKVDNFLKVNENCFIAGDAAYFEYKQAYLRMAVQFAILEGRSAAKNILRSIKKRRLVRYRPLDLGYIIPMANNRSCGQVLGVRLTGPLPTLLHFLMCAYRLWSPGHSLGMFRDLLKFRSFLK